MLVTANLNNDYYYKFKININKMIQFLHCLNYKQMGKKEEKIKPFKYMFIYNITVMPFCCAYVWIQISLYFNITLIPFTIFISFNIIRVYVKNT